MEGTGSFFYSARNSLLKPGGAIFDSLAGAGAGQGMSASVVRPYTSFLARRACVG